jgi:hypothetical protein
MLVLVTVRLGAVMAERRCEHLMGTGEERMCVVLDVILLPVSRFAL